MKILSNNKKVNFDYFLSEKLEVGIVLTGAEAKSIISGNISLKESYVNIINGEVFLTSAQITPADNLVFSYYSNFEPKRDKKLLLHRKQIKKFQKLIQEKGNTIVMTKMYIADNGIIKAEIALGKGKKLFEKKNTIKERDLDRQIRIF